jgi:hypothetical protein
MRLARTFRLTLAIAACTAATAQASLAGGEPKTLPPFTTPVSKAKTTPAMIIPASAIAAGRAAIVAEPKNVFPFTQAFATDALERYLGRVSGVRSNTGSGEAKNEAPFTHSVGR